MRTPRPPQPIDVDLGPLEHADLAIVDALAHLALEARRLGLRVRVRDANEEVAGFLELAGLAAALGLTPPALGGRAGSPPRRLRGKAVGQAEQREVASRVEEERDAGDPVA